jgi:phage terminase large subunit-like protein
MGRIEPRLETPTEAVDSFGLEAADLAKSVLGITLMDWQVRALSGMLSHDGTGRLINNEAMIGTGRQNGKSWMLRALCVAWALKGPNWWGRPQEVQIVANKKKRAMETWRFLANTLERADLATVRRTNGDEAILCHNGSVISMGVARADEHGGSPDLLAIDELWDISSDVLFDAFRPSQVAKPNPLLACFSTAGDQSSTAMQMLREQALNAIDKGISNGLYWCEWSPPPGVNCEDRQWWPWSNPALGTTIQWRALEKAFAGPDRGAFLRAHMNLWIASADSWLPFGMWAERLSKVPMPAGGILCVDNSLDNDTLYCGVRAVQHEGGVIVTTEFVVDSQSQMWAEVNRVMQDRDVQLRINPTLFPLTPPDLKRRTEDVGYKQLKGATPICRGMIIEDKLHHTGEVALAEHVTRAVMVKVDDGAPLSSQKSPGAITLARCMVFAAAEAGRPIRSSRAAFAFG